MTTYKPGQGRQLRTGLTVLLVLVAAWGCFSFMEYGNSKLDRLIGNDEPFFSKAFLGGGSSMTDWLTPSFILAMAVFFAAVFWVRSFLNKEKNAEHLIGTELELRRVKWPSKEEVMVSGARVVYYTGMLALVIAILDFDMATIVQHYVLGQNLNETGWGKLLSLLPGITPGTKSGTVALEIGTILIIGLQAYTLISLSRSANAAAAEKKD